MKTLQELYKEIGASDELKAAFAEAAKSGKAVDFLREKGCETTVEELTTDSFAGVDIALFSAGASRSREFADAAVKADAVDDRLNVIS